MTTGTIIIIAVFVILILLVLYTIVTYNKLVKLRNMVNDQWSQIEVMLKRRFDLIPNVVEAVKGYAKHESDTLKGIIEARNKFNVASTPSQEIDASNQLSKAFITLFALSESYPDLKADTNFLKLESTLEDTENKISTARAFYNDTVLNLNNKTQMFPSNIIAKIFKFECAVYFKDQDNLDEVPKVKF